MASAGPGILLTAQAASATERGHGRGAPGPALAPPWDARPGALAGAADWARASLASFIELEVGTQRRHSVAAARAARPDSEAESGRRAKPGG